MLQVLGWLGIGGLGAKLAACATPTAATDDADPLLPRLPFDDSPTPDPNIGNIRALLDVLLPSERDADGTVRSPGALDVGAIDVLTIETFLPAVQALGLIAAVPERIRDDLAGFDVALVAILEADLAAMAYEHRLLTEFQQLPREDQERAIHEAMDDPVRGPALRFARAACFIAYLGAVHSDLGLRALGFPPFEDFADRRAVSGYPRSRDGRLIDADREDLAALAAADDLDDYTYNRAPAPTDGDDLAVVIDARGDLY